ncbi:RNA polymerase sigma factor [Virgibacillus siamensis]|uniref:RNA polymerase sigma factor n=1 Tax=Virgibacillus siamensis TaxID=480071 RepID=A0ABN1GNR6_9BACI
MTEDRQLIHEIMNGSEAAMEVLTRRYYKSIFSFVYRKVGNKDSAYDLTQDIFIKMIKKIDTYSNKGSFKSWLYTLAVNHCRDYWKSADYKVTSKQSELPDYLSNEQNQVPYIFEKKETREQVKAAVEELPEYQKEVVLLKYFHDLKIRDISEVTKAKESTVKSRLRQGLSKLEVIIRRGEKHEQKRM